MLGDYETIISTEKETMASLILKKSELLRAIDGLENIFDTERLEKISAEKIYLQEIKTIKANFSGLGDTIPLLRERIAQLEKENNNYQDEIQIFKEKQFNAYIVEKKLTEMSSVFFNQISSLLQAYTTSVVFMDRTSARLERLWSQIR
jgi:hypothetical protein